MDPRSAHTHTHFSKNDGKLVGRGIAQKARVVNLCMSMRTLAGILLDSSTVVAKARLLSSMIFGVSGKSKVSIRLSPKLLGSVGLRELAGRQAWQRQTPQAFLASDVGVDSKSPFWTGRAPQKCCLFVRIDLLDVGFPSNRLLSIGTSSGVVLEHLF